MATLDLFFEEVRSVLLDFFGDPGEELYLSGMQIEDAGMRKDFFVRVLLAIRSGEIGDLLQNPALKYKNGEPVDVEEFLLSPFYLGLEGQVYPEVLKEVVELNSGNYVEAVLTGAIGVAKTTIAIWTTAYQLYLLSCLRDPQREYGLERASEIVFIFQSINKDLAKSVDFARFRALIQNSRYFQKHFPFNKDVQSELHFPNRVIVKPVSGLDTAAIGQNVFGGVIDELNYMAVIEKSKSSVDGGTYDQAVAVYNSIARRRKSRFLNYGKLPGILCLVSSKKYPGQFTDVKQEEAKRDPTIFVYDKRVWEIKPEAFKDGGWFRVFIGDQTRRPKILDQDEEVFDSDGLIMEIPEAYRVDFENDIINALREIAGVSTLASHPFIVKPDAVDHCFVSWDRSILSAPTVDFKATQLAIYPKKIKNAQSPRFAHVDLGLTGDSAGVAMGYVERFVQVDRGDSVEYLPVVVYDFVLEVQPPKGDEIQFWKIRDLFYKLKKVGVPLKWISYDSYQSIDSMQLLRRQGFVTGHRSMDTSREPYDTLKQAIYDERLMIPEHKKLRTELLSLEDDPKSGKIDHPPQSSKDISDAVAGVYYGLYSRKEIWVAHNIPLDRIPVTQPQKKTEDNLSLRA